MMEVRGCGLGRWQEWKLHGIDNLGIVYRD